MSHKSFFVPQGRWDEIVIGERARTGRGFP